MSECIEEYKWQIVFGGFFASLSLILNCVLYFKIPDPEEERNKKIGSVNMEMVKLETNNKLEEYVMTIGEIGKNNIIEPPIIEKSTNKRIMHL